MFSVKEGLVELKSPSKIQRGPGGEKELKKLLLGWRGGCEESGFVLYSIMKKPLRFIIERRLKPHGFQRQDFEDCEQDMWARLFRRCKEMEDEEILRYDSLSSYLSSTAFGTAEEYKNKSFAHLRQGHAFYTEYIQPGAYINQFRALKAKEAFAALSERFRGLKPEHRLLILLRCGYGYSFREIAGILGIEVETGTADPSRSHSMKRVYRRFKYAKDELRSAVEGFL